MRPRIRFLVADSQRRSTVRRYLIRSLMLAACWAVVPPAIVCAQETINYASVSGRVTDPQGAVVPGAQVSARQTETNVTPETVTDSEGRFRFPYLKVGPYEVKVQSAGFIDSTRTLRLTVGSAFDIPGRCSRGRTRHERHRHRRQRRSSRRRAARLPGTVPQSEVQSLPMNGRNFLDLALLIPGVSPTNVGSTQLFAETSAVPGQGISVASQRNLSNSFIVDGLSANDDAAGLSGIPYGVDAVEQFQVVTSGGQAELGRALGGYINVVTKSGTNAMHGTRLRLHPRRQLQRARTRCPGRRCRWTSSSTAAAWAARSCATGRSTSRTSSSGCSIRPASSRSFRRTCPIINAQARGGRLSRVASQHRHLSEPGSQRQLPRKARSSGQRIGSAHGEVQPLSRHVGQLAWRRRAERPELRRPAWTTSTIRSRSATPGRFRRGPSTKRARSLRTAT